MSLRVVNGIIEDDDSALLSLTKDQRLHFSCLAMSSMFNEFSKSKGFDTFKTIGKLNAPCKNFLVDTVWHEPKKSLPLFLATLTEMHPGFEVGGIQPYVLSTVSPNVISVFHLAAQSLCHEYV